jgi:hypothetical protein
MSRLAVPPTSDVPPPILPRRIKTQILHIPRTERIRRLEVDLVTLLVITDSSNAIDIPSLMNSPPTRLTRCLTMTLSGHIATTIVNLSTSGAVVTESGRRYEGSRPQDDGQGQN